MAAILPPGIGNEAQATQATAFIRQQPWYAQWLASQGIQTNDPAADDVKLNEDQQQELLALAQQHGIGINEDDFHFNENGQIAKNDSHWLRNTLIGAGIAGSMFIPGVGPAVLSGLGHVGSTLGTIGSTIGKGALAVGKGALGVGGAGGAGGGGGTLSTIGSLLGAGGQAIGAATQASGQNRLNQENLGLQANQQNITGQRSDVLNQTDVAKTNTTLGNQRLKDAFAIEMAKHPSVSPFNPTGGRTYSPEYLAALAEGAASRPAPLAAPRPYNPLDIKNVQASTGTEKGTLEKIGDWLSPSLSIAGKLPLFRGNSGSDRIPVENFY